MKKLFIIVLVAVTGLTSSAQLRTSRTLVKKENPTTWILRAGLTVTTPYSMDSYEKDNGFSASGKAGFDIDFGFNKPIGSKGAYWGMELGILSHGVTVKNDKANWKGSGYSWGVKLTPFTIGYKFGLSETMKLDPHLGIFASYDFTNSIDEGSNYYFDRDCPFDAGIQVGVGAWFNKFNVDVSYQAGLIPNQYMDPTMGLGAVLVRLGYAF